MAPYTFSTDDWPSKDENGKTIHYAPDISSPPLHRGMLVSSSRGQPAVPFWKILQLGSDDDCGDLLNLVQYTLPRKIDESKRRNAEKSLETGFALAFPGKEPASVTIRKNQFVHFWTTSDNVRASEIISVASTEQWKADGQPLGRPQYVGLETTELLQAIKFEGVPREQKDSFLSSLPHFFGNNFDPTRQLEVIDIWEQQSRPSYDAEWKFDEAIWVLLCAETLQEGDDMDDVVISWPGWYHFEDEYLVKISYNGRFEFCEWCRHSAQDIEGANRRHTTDECIRLMCGNCGHNGHDSSKPGASEKHKNICEEGKKRRREEREESKRAAKRQKTTQNARSKEGKASIDGIAMQKHDSQETIRSADEAAKK